MPAKPKSAFPDPAAKLPGEIDILAGVIANLADHDAKLVYADWLEERDDSRGPLLRKFVTAYRVKKKLPPVNAAPGNWCDLVGLTLMAQLRKTRLSPKADAVLAFARPAIVHAPARTAERWIPVGASKSGGRPDMPLKTVWPWDRRGMLSFLAQFNLADLQESPVARELPASGLLSVFCLYNYGTDFTKTNWRLLHFPDPSKLVRRDAPIELPKKYVVPSGRMEFHESLMLPDPDSPWGEELLRAVRPVDRKGSEYGELLEDMGGGDAILGYPRCFEGDILGKKRVRHLLTVGDDGTEDFWPDGNMMFVTIAEADLKAARFNQAKATLQCF